LNECSLLTKKQMCCWLKIIKMPYHIIGLGFLTFQFTFDFSFFPVLWNYSYKQFNVFNIF
jgi:hypothetical protein